MSGGGGGTDGDVDLNIAPIVDCFTVLIAYMLVSISFISLQILNVEVSASGPPPTEAPPPPPPEPPLTLSVEVSDSRKIELKLTGGAKNLNEDYPIEPSAPGVFNLDAMTEKILKIKQANPTVTEANVTAEPVVRYKAMIQVIEVLKANLTKVFISS